MHPTVDPDFDSGGYGLIDLGGANLLIAESVLFLYVIIQAFADIGMFTAPHGNYRYRRDKDPGNREYQEALQWLLYDRRDFFQVCEHAGADGPAMRNHVRKFLLSKV